MTPPSGSLFLDGGFVVISLGMIATFTWLVLRARGVRDATLFLGAAGLWASTTMAAAAAGLLADFSLPPRLFAVLGGGAVLLVVFVRAWGRELSRLPWRWLIGLQAFRVVVEILIHRAVIEGVAPPQMTWSGFNLDVITGVTALPVAALAARGRLPPLFIGLWNVMGCGLLAAVVTVGVLSMPTPLQVMEPDNTWIAFAPYVWLPAVLVAAAVALHVLSFLKLRSR